MKSIPKVSNGTSLVGRGKTQKDNDLI